MFLLATFCLGYATADHLIPAIIFVALGCIGTIASVVKTTLASSPDSKALGMYAMAYGILWMGLGGLLIFAGY